MPRREPGSTKFKEHPMKSKSSQRGSMSVMSIAAILLLGFAGIFFFLMSQQRNTAEDHAIRAQQQCDIAQQQLRSDLISGNPKSVLVSDGQQIKTACAAASQADKAEQAQDQKQGETLKSFQRALVHPSN
jgi:uncharacterized protein HemX